MSGIPRCPAILEEINGCVKLPPSLLTHHATAEQSLIPDSNDYNQGPGDVDEAEKNQDSKVASSSAGRIELWGYLLHTVRHVVPYEESTRGKKVGIRSYYVLKYLGIQILPTFPGCHM